MVSVIIPTFNRKGVLPRALDSVLNQTYSDFEVLIIDDGSTDDTKSVLKKYLKDSRFKYFFKKNGGVSSARNFGIKKAMGDYIAFLDSDDEFEKEKLEVQLSEMEKFDAVSSVCSFVNGMGESFLFDQEYFAYNRVPGAGSCFMMKNKEPLFFNENLSTSEDIDYVMRYFSFSKVLFVKKSLVKIHKSLEKGRLSGNTENKIQGLKERKKLFENDEYNLSEDLNNYYLGNLNLSLGLWNFFDGNFVEGRVFLKKGLVLVRGFKKRLVYKTMYFFSFIPFLFNLLKKTAMFFWKKGLIKI